MPTLAEKSAGPVAFYPMSAYTQGVRRAGLYHIIRLGDQQLGKLGRLIPEPHRHDFFEIVWVRRGAGTVEKDLRTYEVRAQTLFFTSPGQVHRWQLGGAAEGYIASFSAELFGVNSEDPGFLGRLAFLWHAEVDPVLRANRALARRVEHVFSELMSCGADAFPGRDDLVRAYLTILLTHVRAAFAEAGPDEAATDAGDLLTRRFRLALAMHPPGTCTVRDIAKALGVSRSQLNDHLTHALGRPASTLIHEHTVLEAKRLLRHTTLTSAQIAYRLHFRDPSYFGRFFRRETGMTPRSFRQKAQSDERGE